MFFFKKFFGYFNYIYIDYLFKKSDNKIFLNKIRFLFNIKLD